MQRDLSLIWVYETKLLLEAHVGPRGTPELHEDVGGDSTGVESVNLNLTGIAQCSSDGPLPNGSSP